MAKEELSTLEPVDMSENLIIDWRFRDLSDWKDFDTHTKHGRGYKNYYGHYMSWKRENSGNDGTTVGVSLGKIIDVSRFKPLELSFDVWIDSHSLKGTGKWSEQHGGDGEMPVMISIYFQGEDTKHYYWTYGFISEENPKEKSSIRNVMKITKQKWHHFSCVIPDDIVWSDSRQINRLPRPKQIKQIMVFGKGWDFSGAIGNLLLIPAGIAKPKIITSPKPSDITKKPVMKRKEVKLKNQMIIVDGSNVAWGSRKSELGQKPLAKNISLVIEALKQKGFGNILTIVDAALVYQVEDKDEYARLEREGIIEPAPAENDADNFIIKYAKKNSAFVITNDTYKKDWAVKDPWVKNNINKFRISHMVIGDQVEFGELIDSI